MRQPYASLIAWGIKDIENRTWQTAHRGSLLIHASSRRDRGMIAEAVQALAEEGVIVTEADFPTGGLVGQVELVECVSAHDSEWFDGPVGWVLANAVECEFAALPGRLGLFDVDIDSH